MTIVGRLKPGATVRARRPEFTLLAKQMESQHPERNPVDPRLVPLEQRINGRVRPALLVLACAVGVVMLIVCANLSNLQLARLGARQKELAMRAALGRGPPPPAQADVYGKHRALLLRGRARAGSRDGRHACGGASERLQSSFAEQRAHRRKRARLHASRGGFHRRPVRSAACAASSALSRCRIR